MPATGRCQQYTVNDCTSSTQCSVGSGTNVEFANARTGFKQSIVPNPDGSFRAFFRDTTAEPGDSYNMFVNNCVGSCTKTFDMALADVKGQLSNCVTGNGCNFVFNALLGATCPII